MSCKDHWEQQNPSFHTVLPVIVLLFLPQQFQFTLSTLKAASNKKSTICSTPSPRPNIMSPHCHYSLPLVGKTRFGWAFCLCPQSVMFGLSHRLQFVFSQGMPKRGYVWSWTPPCALAANQTPPFCPHPHTHLTIPFLGKIAFLTTPL